MSNDNDEHNLLNRDLLNDAAPALWHALVGILESLEDAARNNPEAYLEFINEIAVDLPLAQAVASAAVQKSLGESRGRKAPLEDEGSLKE